MHHLSLLSIISEDIAMHTLAKSNICTKMRTRYKSMVLCKWMSRIQTALWGWFNNLSYRQRDMFTRDVLFNCLTFCRAMCKMNLAVSQLLSNPFLLVWTYCRDGWGTWLRGCLLSHTCWCTEAIYVRHENKWKNLINSNDTGFQQNKNKDCFSWMWGLQTLLSGNSVCLVWGSESS